jgi:hypothetical protein
MTPDVALLVQAYGAEPFNHQFFLDHRGLCVDLQLLGLFVRNLSSLASPKYHDIQSRNPTLIRKYITYLSQRLAANNILAPVALLESTAVNTAAQQLDEEVTNAMLAAGKVCAHTAWLPVFPQLHKA